MSKEEPIVIKKEGVSKEELAKALEENTKKILEAFAPKQQTQSVAIVEDKEPDDYREPLAASIKSTDEADNFKFTGKEDIKLNEIKKLGQVRANESQKKHMKEAIGAVTATNAVPEIWSSEVSRGCRYPESAFWNAPFINWVRDLYGKPGKTVDIITVGTTECTNFACDEPTTTAASVSKTPCVLVEKGCAYYICKEDIEDVVPDTIDALNEGLGRCLAQCIDNYFLGQAMISNAGTVSYSTCLTAAKIACVMGSMRNGTCDPVALIIHPVVEAGLLQDSQFTNAATFGERSVIESGHVYKWLGLDVITIPKGTLHPGGGTYYSLMLAQDAIAGAKKREIEVESEYVVRLRRKYVLASARFCGTPVHTAGVWWIRSVETCCG